MSRTFIFVGFLISSSNAFFPQLSLTRKNYSNVIRLASSSKRGGAMSRRRKEKKSGGFDAPKQEKEQKMMQQPPSKIKLKSNTDEIYSFPALYDLAFGYRSYEDEVQFLLERHEQHGTTESKGTEPLHILELAAGPGRHSIAALMQDEYPVQVCKAVDLSTDMQQYSKELAAQEFSSASKDHGDINSRFNYHVNDMRQLSTEHFEEETFDTAWILLGSMAHLITNQDVLDCFDSTSRALKSGGTFILELAHPRETFSMVDCTKNEWTVPLEDDGGNVQFGELNIIWGDENDPFDPIRQVRDFTVAMELKEKGEGGVSETKQKVKQVVPMRLFTAQEIDALARLSGFQIVETFGALDENIDVNSDEEAYRLVCILRKK